MRRIVFLALFFLFSSISLGAVETRTGSIYLQGVYEDALDMTVTPLSASDESFVSGMPFSIEDSSVAYSATGEGRLIATWNLISNMKFNIYMRAESMYHYSDVSKANPLDYILTWAFNLSYNEGNSYGSFSIPSGEPDESGVSSLSISVAKPEGQSENFYKIDLLSVADISSTGNYIVGLSGGNVFFKFARSSSDDLSENGDNYPVGYYYATVTFFVEGDQ